ncbi:MAG TPA: nitrilase-related carbon-nitrogen hydrolase [Anaerolineae bacterium]|nr:nitrilase-related carbon-nitrogen hydrolase [Anaerolineae bacterium]HQK13106.1 nitrilase-related carbon-nitrogen hydrolase [Anaerolineae bacterium]
MKPSTLHTIGRIVLGLALAALSAVLVTLAFPPFNLWFLVWFAAVPAVVAQYRIMPRKLSSLASAVFNGGWVLGYLGPVFAGSGNFMEYLWLYVLIISFLADMGNRAFHERTRYRWFVPQSVIGWVGIEMIRSFLPIAGTWGFIAYTLYRQPWLIQPASIFSIFGVSTLIMLVNYALGLGAIALYDRRWQTEADAPTPSPVTVRRWLIGVGATLAAWTLLSLVLFRHPTTPTVKVAAVQPEASVILAAFSGLDDKVAKLSAQMVAQTRNAAAQGAEFIVWPEGAMPFDPQVEDKLGLRDLARETGAHLAVGYGVVTDAGLRNEATVINPQGEFLGVFGKDHPVTFGGETSLTRGTYPVYDTPLGKLGTIICYDLDFTDTARKLARQGAQLIAVPSNDWSAITYKHYTHLVFRAVENRVTMVKADGSFDSAVIDPYGRILALATIPEGGAAILVTEAPLGTASAPAIFLGDWIGWLSLAGLAFFTFGGGWLVKQAEKGSRVVR